MAKTEGEPTPAVPDAAAAARNLIDRLSPENGERAVLSAIYQCDGAELTLRHASLLIGPPEVADVPWGRWRSDSTARLHPRFDELSQLPPDILASDAPTADGTELVAGRASLDVEDARRLLAEVLERGEVPAVGPLPGARAPLAAPDAFLHVFPRLWTPASRLVAQANRPLRGFLLPRVHRLDELLVKDRWTVEGVTVFDGAWSALGIAMPYEGHRFDPPAHGLLVGRLERRAWFDDVKGDGDFNLYELHVGLEPDRIDIADLEVELEEWADGELANSRRLLLGELGLGARAGEQRVLVALPTLGRGLAHEARLYDREGTLLDRTQRSKLVERIISTMRVAAENGQTALHTFTAGEKVVPAVTERLDRLDRLEQDYRDLMEQGLSERIVRDRNSAITAVHNHLAGAPGEIWIMDPYFGAASGDWDVLRGLNVSVKILTGRPGKSPPSAFKNVEVRRWNGPGKSPPFHDRSYLWEGRGLSVGTSPSGFGIRDTRVDRLRQTEAERMRADFQHYWNSGDFLPA